MKLPFKNKIATLLDEEIERVILEMSVMSPESKEYGMASSNLEKLYSAKEKLAKFKLSPDTILVVVGSLLEVGLILNYEKLGFISTKAMQFVLKGRVK